MKLLVDIIKVDASSRQMAALERVDMEDFELVAYKTKKSYNERGIFPAESFLRMEFGR